MQDNFLKFPYKSNGYQAVIWSQNFKFFLLFFFLRFFFFFRCFFFFFLCFFFFFFVHSVTSDITKYPTGPGASPFFPNLFEKCDFRFAKNSRIERGLLQASTTVMLRFINILHILNLSYQKKNKELKERKLLSVSLTPP